MKLLAEANENPEIFKMKATCSGKGWIQEGNNRCKKLYSPSLQRKKYRAGNTGFYCISVPGISERCVQGRNRSYNKPLYPPGTHGESKRAS